MHKPQCVLITGGSRGIGRACCDTLAQQNINVVSLSRKAAEHLPSSQTHYSIDLNDIQASVELVQHILKEHPIDALVCNAGVGHIGSLENFSATQIQQSLMLNLASPLALVRTCLPMLRTRKRSNVVFIGSNSALQGGRYGTLYSAAKFGLRGASQALSAELAGANCHVGIINPGSVRTDFFNELNFEPGPEPSQALLAEDVSTAVLHMLSTADRAVVSEINVQPRHHVVQKRTPAKKP